MKWLMLVCVCRGQSSACGWTFDYLELKGHVRIVVLYVKEHRLQFQQFLVLSFIMN